MKKTLRSITSRLFKYIIAALDASVVSLQMC